MLRVALEKREKEKEVFLGEVLPQVLVVALLHVVQQHPAPRFAVPEKIKTGLGNNDKNIAKTKVGGHFIAAISS